MTMKGKEVYGRNEMKGGKWWCCEMEDLGHDSKWNGAGIIRNDNF